ncbi:MAG: prepilin-type N-terminal cleavage/methylation domain-containing protein [Nitrospira sp.]|nr:prepilin-type N-terminal cleavage/methylation domain-containing protein [Nitrospira sp.]
MTQSGVSFVTRRSPWASAAGFTLVESMVALVVLSIGVIGTIGMCEWAERGLQRGALTTTALALVESRLEAKRSVSWERLLMDDLDQDGIVESVMRDDGMQDDQTNGDGIFTASVTQSHIRLVWTVELNRGHQPAEASLATIEARAIFRTMGGQEKEIRVRTIRANPRYVGLPVLS